MKTNRLEDIRILVWLQDKLLWLSRDPPDLNFFPELVAYRYKTDSILRLRDEVVWFPIVPIKADVSLRTTGPNSASVTFASNRDYFLTRSRQTGDTRRYFGVLRTSEEREQYRKWVSWKKGAWEEAKIHTNYTLPVDTADSLNKDYFDAFYSMLQDIYGRRGNYKFPETMIPESYSRVDEERGKLLNFNLAYDHLSWPYIVFQPMLPIWIDVRDEEGNWRALFTGYIESVSDSYSAGNTRQISLGASSALRVLDSIPSFPNILDTIFWRRIIEDRYGGDKGKFLELYFLKLAGEKDETFWPDYWQDKETLDILRAIFRTANFRLGIMSDSELEELKVSEAALFGAITDRDKKTFKELFRRFAFHRFSLFGFTEDDTRKLRFLPYDGKDNIRNANSFDHVLMKDLRPGVKVLESLGDIYIAPELLEGKGGAQEIIQLFKRVIGYSVAYFHPQRQNLSVVLKKISETLKMDVYNSPTGDLIIEFPRVNYRPRFAYLSSSSPDSSYKDHSDRYVLKEDEIVNANFQETGKVVTEYQVKGAVDVINVSDFINTSMCSGFGFADPSLILRFGLVEGGSDTIYFTLEKLADTDRVRVMQFANELSECFLEHSNAKSFTATFRLINRTDLLPGRTILAPQREFLYYITQISYDISPGQNFATSISSSYGHPFDYPLLEMPEIFAKYRDLRLPKLTFTTRGANSPTDNMLWSLQDFGIWHVGAGRGVDRNVDAPWAEQVYFNALFKPLCIGKTSIPPGIFNALVSADQKTVAKVLSRISRHSSQPGKLTTFDLSEATNKEDVVYMSARVAFQLLYWRFLWWNLIQRITAFGALITYLVNNNEDLSAAVDYAAKLVFFQYNPEADYSEVSSIANWVSQLKGARGRIVNMDPVSIGGVDLLDFYQKLLKKAPNLHKAVFACETPIKLEKVPEAGYEIPIIPKGLEILKGYTFNGTPVNSIHFGGFSVARLGISSAVDPRPSGRISRHPLRRACDIDYLAADFTHPSAMLAFLIGLDMLMLSRPVYIAKESNGGYGDQVDVFGAWTQCPPYSKEDSVPKEYQYAWFLWRLDREIGVRGTPYSLYTTSLADKEGKLASQESNLSYYSWLLKGGKKIPPLGLNYLFHAVVAARGASGECEGIDYREVAARMLGNFGFCEKDYKDVGERWPQTYVSFASGPGKEEVKTAIDNEELYNLAEELANSGILVKMLPEDLSGWILGGPSEVHPYNTEAILGEGNKTGAFRRMRLVFSVIGPKADKDCYYYGFFLFCMLAVMYRWGWLYHVLQFACQATNTPHRFYDFDGTYSELYSLIGKQGYGYLVGYKQPPVILNRIQWNSKDGKNLFYIPGLADWYDIAPIYITGTIATRWTDRQELTAKAPGTSYYMRMAEVYKVYKNLEKAIADCNECKGAEGGQQDNQIGFNKAACPGFETFVSNSEWRNAVVAGKPNSPPWEVRDLDNMAHMNHIHTDVGRYTSSAEQYWINVLRDIGKLYANELEQYILYYELEGRSLAELAIELARQKDEAQKQGGV